MDSARAYTFRVIAVSAVVLSAGFVAGFYGAGMFARAEKNGKAQSRIVANTIMTKRMAAIDAALKNGTTEYDFNFVSPSPILGKR
jgi:hypothetical protein